MDSSPTKKNKLQDKDLLSTSHLISAQLCFTMFHAGNSVHPISSPETEGLVQRSLWKPFHLTIVSCMKLCRQHVMCRHVPLPEPRNPGHMHCLDPFAYMPVRTKKTIKGMLVPWQPRLIQLKITLATDRTFLPLTDDNDGFHFTWHGLEWNCGFDPPPVDRCQGNFT